MNFSNVTRRSMSTLSLDNDTSFFDKLNSDAFFGESEYTRTHACPTKYEPSGFCKEVEGGSTTYKTYISTCSYKEKKILNYLLIFCQVNFSLLT